MVAVVEPMKVCKMFGAYATVAGVRRALPLLHAPCGCQYYIRACMLLHDGIDPVILTSDISQQDVIFGGEERLRDSILACQKAYDPDLIVVLSGCAPSLVGDDIQAVADSLEGDVRADVLTVDAAGFQGDQASGFKDVMLRLVSFYARDSLKVRENVVNLIGIIPGYDYRWRFDILSLTETLAAAGIEVNAVLGGFNALEQIESVGCAELNVVLSDIRGLEIAKYLKQRFGTPYIHPRYLPIGMQSTQDWLAEISQHVSNFDRRAIERQMEKAVKPFEYADLALVTTYTVDATAVIVAEPHRAISLVKFLAQDVGLTLRGICVTESNGRTETLLKKSLAELGQRDCRILLTPDAFVLRQAIDELKPDVIYGSTFDRACARRAGASLIKIGYPSYDEVLMTERPYMGFAGIPVLMEDLVNAIIRREL
jgi:light-independent protochlorophyllide reductase B subunit